LLTGTIPNGRVTKGIRAETNFVVRSYNVALSVARNPYSGIPTTNDMNVSIPSAEL
jgi:hypothetical protein